MTSPFRRRIALSSAQVRRRMRERFADPGALRQAIRRAAPTPIDIALDQDETGRAETGLDLLSGRAAFGGAEAQTQPRGYWKTKPPTPQWLDAAHGFEWLADLAALGDAGARDAARACIAAWLDQHMVYTPPPWGMDVAARRLRAWLVNAALFAPKDARSVKGAQVLAAAAAHADWLSRRLAAEPHGVARIRAAVAVSSAALALAGWEDRRAAADAQLVAALEGGLSPDGTPQSRAPSDALDLFERLELLSRWRDDLELGPLPAMEEALDRLTDVCRFFRHGDGALALFNGGRAGPQGGLDAVLARRRAPGAPPGALPGGGYERLSGGRVLVLIDVGAAPPPPGADTAHAGALAIEMSTGRRRLIVNCGSGVHRDDEWRSALRRSAAHSVCVVDDASSAQTVYGGPLAEDRALVGPADIQSERREERNGVWVRAAHGGFRARYGLLATRRLFLSADGGDFRGEDRIEIAPDGAAILKRALARRSRSERAAGLPFTARFHLHPDVAAALVADGEAVTLRLPHGEVWVMRQAGGTLAIEKSLYVERAGPPRDSQQITVSGRLKPGETEEAQIRWAFRRVGELAQLPKDVNALLAEVGEAAL